ncbi:MAG: 4-alpha-glucanotransferase, partial [Erysipelotrichaceae bacterium]|nr:4-alpha-glucanotransferase [Erysipelotrichaceae bacterium]
LKNRRRESIEKIKEEYHEEIEFHMVIQYLFYKQWNNLKSYANTNGIKLIGDCPIYIALDSADVWINTSLFQLDDNNIPTRVAGCPPDGFSATGQLWGNPLYDWEQMKNDNYRWWIKRIEHLNSIYDIVRIDHFRGFESYYAIPYGEVNAINGTWLKGPGMDLFNAIKKESGDIDIIAEDLGFITEEVHKLLDDSGFPGMKVLEFAFDSRDANGPLYYPHTYPKNCIAYVGTHDNETIMGWKGSIEDNDLVEAKKYMMIEDDNDFNWKMISVLMMSVANTTILQAQDILGLDNKARMNTPSTTGINWVWRAKEGSFNDELALKLYSYTKRYARIA